MMKNDKSLPFFILILFSFVLVGCTSGVYQAPTLEVLPTEIVNEYIPEDETTPEVKPRFTIESDPEFLEPISAIYQTFFAGEMPVFVDHDADLHVTSPVEDRAIHPNLQVVFLPNGVLIPQNDSPEVNDFINFALSADGQQALVDSNFLPESITLTDQAGNLVEINLPVHRVLSAYGPVTSIVYSVDAEDRLVSASYLGARDPLGSSVMEKMDPRFPGIKGDDSFSQSEFNIEEAAALDPDLIIANARSSWLDSVEQLDIPVFLYDPETPERLKEAVILTGQIFGPHQIAQAQAWVQYFESTVERIGDQVRDIPDEERLNTLFTGTDPLKVASRDMFQSYIIEAVGGNSVTSELSGYWNNVNLEQVILWNPDVIIVPPYGGASVEAITESQEWQILDAVQQGHVYRMPKLVAPWDTPSPDAVLGIIWMGHRLYPDQVDIECSTEAKYFYQTFFDYEITEEELATICRFE